MNDGDDSLEPLRRALRAAFEEARRTDKPQFKPMYRIDAAPFRPTDRTVHYSGTERLPPAKRLEIGVFEPGNGYYLVHYDDDGGVQTNTFHETLDSAFAQADWEFAIPKDAWTAVERS